MRPFSRIATVLLSCVLAAIGLVAGGDLASSAPAGAPLRLTGISPTAGAVEGGNEVTIRAEGAADVTSVDFGAVSGGEITHVNAHLLFVVAPAHDAGRVDVVLRSASATSPVSPAGRYRFVAAPDPLHLEVSQRLGSPLGVGLLDAIGCTLHNFCAVEMRNRTGQVTALATFGAGHPSRVQQLPDNPVIGQPYCNGYCDNLMACGTPHFCVVGDRRYLRVWNGRRWGDARQFNSRDDEVISCAPGTKLCVLGNADDTFVHDSHGWRTVRFPHKFPYPKSLSCATARFCVARSSGPTAVFDGASWRLVRARTPIPREVGCASAHYCLAVGDHSHEAAVFDGTGWRSVAAPPVTDNVQSVSCIAVGRCVAATTTAAEAFAHGKWTSSRTPLEVTAFACVPHGVCRATFDNGQTLRFEHEHWTHTEDITAYHDRLADISCASPTWCLAVSLSGEAFRYAHGTWSREGHVDGRHRLTAISCSADRVCVAVDGADGRAKSGVFSGGRAVRYSHGRWQRPVVIDTGHRLVDVSCASAEHCVAVETDRRAITYRHGTWTEPTRLPPGPKHGLRYTDSIDCPTVHYCATTGYPSYELVDGTWREIHFAFPTETAGIDCVSASYCVFGDTDGLGARNDGVLGSLHDGCCYPEAVSCASRSYCAAVFADDHQFARRTYVMNGAASRRVKRLSRTGHPGPPAGIACFAGPVCVGVTNTHGFVGT